MNKSFWLLWLINTHVCDQHVVVAQCKAIHRVTHVWSLKRSIIIIHLTLLLVSSKLLDTCAQPHSKLMIPNVSSFIKRRHYSKWPMISRKYRVMTSWYGSLFRVVTFHCNKPPITYAGMICCLCSQVQSNTKTIDCSIVGVTLTTDPGKSQYSNNIWSCFRIVGLACSVVSGLSENIFGHTKTTLDMCFPYWLVKALSLVTDVRAAGWAGVISMR